MATFRIHKNNNYTVMSNEHLRNKDLSLKAKGLLSLMLSLPDDWDYSVLGLSKLSKDGKDSVMSTLNELKDTGYVRMSQSKSHDGRFGSWDYDVYESSIFGKPDSEKPYAENPNTENPQQLNTNSNNSTTNSRIINNTPISTTINNKQNTINNYSPQSPQGVCEEVSVEEQMFEEFRRMYKGSKRGCATEFENFRKKHRDWREVLPRLSILYQKQQEIKEEAKRKGAWIPQEKNLQTYINNRCWEEEVHYECSTKNTTECNGESDFMRQAREWAASDANPFRNMR